MKNNEETINTQTTSGEGTPHTIVKGLTSIIVPIYLVGYHLFHYTGNAIGSVREHTDSFSTPYEIIIVDDGSPIKLPDAKQYNVDKYTKNEENVGVTKSWNKGIRISQGEYICLLNNDTMVFNHWLPDMQEALQYLDLVMATPMYGEPFSRAFESGKKREKWMEKPIEESFSDFKDFSCVLAKRSLFSELGVFDENFRSYASDSDFLRRMKDAGKKFASTKRVNTFHVIDATGASIPETPDIMNKDKQVYKEKWEKVKEVSKSMEPTPTPTFGAPPAHPNPSPSAFDVKPEEPKVYTLENMPKLIRTAETGDKIYLTKEGKAHWIVNPKVLNMLGFEFGDDTLIPRIAFIKLKPGEPINLMNVERYKEIKSPETNVTA